MVPIIARRALWSARPGLKRRGAEGAADASGQHRALPANETVVVGSFRHWTAEQLSPDGDVGLDALDNSTSRWLRSSTWCCDLTAGVAFASTLLLTEAPRLALLAHLLPRGSTSRTSSSSCQPRSTSRSCRRTRRLRARLRRAEHGSPAGERATSPKSLAASTATRLRRTEPRRRSGGPQTLASRSQPRPPWRLVTSVTAPGLVQTSSKSRAAAFARRTTIRPHATSALAARAAVVGRHIDGARRAALDHLQASMRMPCRGPSSSTAVMVGATSSPETCAWDVTRLLMGVRHTYLVACALPMSPSPSTSIARVELVGVVHQPT